MKLTRRKNSTKATLTIDGVKANGVYIIGGPWVGGVDPDLIKLKRSGSQLFPKEFRESLKVENGSDMMIDYFEGDTIRLLPDHPLYDQAKELVL